MSSKECCQLLLMKTSANGWKWMRDKWKRVCLKCCYVIQCKLLCASGKQVEQKKQIYVTNMILNNKNLIKKCNEISKIRETVNSKYRKQ